LSKALHRLAHGGGRPQDAAYLLHIAQNIQGRTICAFGEACAWPVLSFVTQFRDEFEARAAAGQTQAAGAGVGTGMKIAASPQV
jgi:NADH-quinone oxidoreductase subunit F